ncbi:MAG: helix-turn-helix domain-containing protein [Pseudomonadota bacterium]
MDSPKDIGSRIRMLRLAQRLTQAGLAELLGVSVSHLSKVEIGHHGVSRIVTERICGHFGCTSDWVLYGRGDHPLVQYPTSRTEKSTWVAKESTSDQGGADRAIWRTPEDCIKTMAEMFEVPAAELRRVVYEFVARFHGGASGEEER